METLVQIRNGLKLRKKRKLELCSSVMSSDSEVMETINSSRIRKGDPTVNRLIPKNNVDKGQQPDFLKEQKKISEKRKIIDLSKKQKKTSASLRKHNNKRGSPKNETLISLFKQQKKLRNLSKKLDTNSRVSKCLKKQCKGFQSKQSLSLHPKEKDSKSLETESLKRKRKLKRKKDKVVRDEASQLLRRARYLLVKLKQEQNLIDAYTAEGWRGQSREKLRPEKELQRAEEQILKCKLGLRDTVRQLDLLGSVGQIDDSFIASDGSVHHEHIFCKKCKSQEVSEDNDIILCDGTCKCAFHQKCIDPPLATEDIPPEDEGWLCKYCDCKMDLLEAINAHLGTEFSEECKWQDIFKEEAILSDAGTKNFNPEEEWPDDESEDNDYDPDRDEINSSTSWCDAREDSGSHEESSTSTSSCSLESEGYWESGLSTESNEISSDIPHLQQNSVRDANDNEIISGPRQRSVVDYKTLYDEMFAKDISNSDVFSEDEDWDPCKRRRRRGKECDAASTLMTLCDNETKLSDSRTPKLGKDHPSGARKPPFRIPCDVLKKLREAFSENELPSREVKKDISELVGLDYAKVNKWFKNARYLALKSRKKEGSPPCAASKKSDDTNESVVSKCSSPILTRKRQLKKVSWDDNLTTLVISAKKKRLKRTALPNTKANVELANNVSLKKHLSNLRTKSRQEKSGRCDPENSQMQSAEIQMEQLCQIDSKLWKLKQVVATFQTAINKDSKEQCLEEKHLIYVPTAEVKEKP